MVCSIYSYRYYTIIYEYCVNLFRKERIDDAYNEDEVEGYEYSEILAID